MSFTAMAVAIGGSAILGAGASLYAGNKQANATDDAGRLTGAAYADSSAKLKPFVDTGASANSKLAQLLGIGTGVTTDDPAYKQAYDAAVAQFDQAHQQRYGMSIWDPRADAVSRDQALGRLRDQAMSQAAQSQKKPDDFGSLLKTFAPGDLTNDPGYQFGLTEGEKRINRGAATQGMYFAPSTSQALVKFNQDYAGTKYNEAFGRDQTNKQSIYGMLSGTSSAGQNAASMNANLGANNASNLSNLLTSGSAANAAGAVGATNALTSGAGSYVNWNQQNQMLTNQNQALANQSRLADLITRAPTTTYSPTAINL